MYVRYETIIYIHFYLQHFIFCDNHNLNILLGVLTWDRFYKCRLFFLVIYLLNEHKIVVPGISNTTVLTIISEQVFPENPTSSVSINLLIPSNELIPVII